MTMTVSTRPEPPAIRRRHAAIERLLTKRGATWKRAPGNRWVLNRSIDMKVTNDRDLPIKVRSAGTIIAGFWMPGDAMDYAEWLAEM